MSGKTVSNGRGTHENAGVPYATIDVLQSLIEHVPLLQLVAGFGYLFGHVFLAQGKYYGWIFRSVGGICWILFLGQNGNTIFMTATIVTTLGMIYGTVRWFFVERRGEFHAQDVAFVALAGIASLGVIMHLVWNGQYSLVSLLETVIIIAEVAGTVLLARKKILGWYCYILMSLLVSLLVLFINPVPAIILGLLELTLIAFDIQGIRLMSVVHDPKRA